MLTGTLHCRIVKLSDCMLQNEDQVVEAFRKDPFGCEGALLQKKEDRDPFAVGPYSSDRCPDMEQLLTHCQNAAYTGQTYHAQLPWDAA